MDEEKKFDIFGPEVILLLILAVGNDFLDVAGDLILPIPVVGQALAAGAEVVNIIVWGIIMFWFTMKLGFGGPAILNAVGGVVEMFGIPARTLTVIGAITLANKPKLAKAVAVAELAAGSVEGIEAIGEEAGAGAMGATESEAASGVEEAGIAGVEGAEGAAIGAEAAEAETTGVAAGGAERTETELGELETPFEEMAKETEEMPKNPWENVKKEAEKLEGESEGEKEENVAVDNENNVVDLSKYKQEKEKREENLPKAA